MSYNSNTDTSSDLPQNKHDGSLGGFEHKKESDYANEGVNSGYGSSNFADNDSTDLSRNRHDKSLGGFEHKKESDLADNDGSRNNYVGDSFDPSAAGIGRQNKSSNALEGFDPTAAGMTKDGTQPTFNTVSDSADGPGFKNNLDEGNAGRLTNQDSSNTSDYQNNSSSNNYNSSSNNYDSSSNTYGSSTNDTVSGGYSGRPSDFADTSNTTRVAGDHSNTYGETYNSDSTGNAGSGNYTVQSSSQNSAFAGDNSGDSGFGSSGADASSYGNTNTSDNLYGDPDNTGRGPQTRQTGAYP